MGRGDNRRSRKDKETLRDKVKGCLGNADYDGIAGLFAHSGNRVVRHLISLSYDLENPAAWRAMKAIGVISARLPGDRLRELAQKVLWMMREESGTNARGAPVMLGEILARNPGELDDLVPVLGSFYDEEFFRTGVVYALTRIAETNAGAIRPLVPHMVERGGQEDPEVKGGLIALVARLGMDEYRAFVEECMEDGSRFTRFDGDTLVEESVGETARAALKSLKEPG